MLLRNDYSVSIFDSVILYLFKLVYSLFSSPLLALGFRYLCLLYVCLVYFSMFTVMPFSFDQPIKFLRRLIPFYALTFHHFGFDQFFPTIGPTSCRKSLSLVISDHWSCFFFSNLMLEIPIDVVQFV